MEVTEFWKTLIPSEYVAVTKCYCVVQKHLFRSSGVEIVICTSHGEVLEFSGCQIHDICEISCLDPKSITVFTTYDFKCNIFYIISSGNGIIILSRKGGLKVIEQHQDVNRFLVSDFSNVGFPQLGIWTNDAKQSLTPNKIVEFNEDQNMWSQDSSISNILHEKYQELSMKTEEYEQKLKMKKHLRLYNCEVAGHGYKFPFSSGSVMVQLVGQDGCKDLDTKEQFNRVPALKVAETWQKLHNGKWVIGISVCNKGRRDLLDLQLILRCSCEEKLRYITKLLMYSKVDESAPPPPPCKQPRACSNVTAWNVITTLKPARRAILLGVLETPKFVDKTVAFLSGVITYKFQNKGTIERHVQVPSFRLRVEDFVKRLESPFTSEITEADQLCVQMTSFIVKLPVVFKSNVEPSLQKILVDKLNFIEFSSLGCLFHKGTLFLELAGIMLHVETTSHLKYNLTVCARDVQQVYLLAHCMYSMLSAPHMILYPPEVQSELPRDSLHLNWKNLHQEFKLVLDQLKQYVTGHSKSQLSISWEEYSRFRSQLSELEMKTDISLV